jgi:hypothetical protein
MKFNSFLAFLLTLIAIVTIVAGFSIKFSETFFYRKGCEGYALLLFPDENKVDTVVGKGELVKIRTVNAGSFGDEYQVSLFGPEWALIKPDSFTLRSEEAKTLFLYISPDLGAEGKYDLDVTVKSKCVSETVRMEVGVLPKEIS